MKNLLIILIIALSTVIGCKKSMKPEGFPETVPFQIKVIQEGAGIERVAVSLYQSGSNTPWSVCGMTDANGIAVIQTVQGGYSQDGAVKGEYKVVLRKEPDQAQSASSPAPDPNASSDREAMMQAAQKMADEAAKIIPPAFRTPESSPVSITISEAGENVIDLDQI